MANKSKGKKIEPAPKPVTSTFTAPDAATAYALAYEQWRQATAG